jgi:hypothetical protein
LLPEHHRDELECTSSISTPEKEIPVVMIFVTERPETVPENFCRFVNADAVRVQLLFVEFEVELGWIKLRPVDHVRIV